MKKIDESTKNQKLDLKPDEKFERYDWYYEKIFKMLYDFPVKDLLSYMYNEKVQNLVGLLYLARHLSEEEALEKFKKLGYNGPNHIEEAIAQFTDIISFAPAIVAFSFMNYSNEGIKKYDTFSKDEAIAKIKELGYTEADLIIGFMTLFDENYVHETLFGEMYSYKEVFNIFEDSFGEEGALIAWAKHICRCDVYVMKEDSRLLEAIDCSKEQLEKKLSNIDLFYFSKNVNDDFHCLYPSYFIGALMKSGYSDEDTKKAFLEVGYEIDPDYLKKIRKEQEKSLEED